MRYAGICPHDRYQSIFSLTLFPHPIIFTLFTTSLIYHSWNLSNITSPLSQEAICRDLPPMSDINPFSHWPPFTTLLIYPSWNPWNITPLISPNAICRDLPLWTISPIPPSIHSLFSNHPIPSRSISIKSENCKYNHILVWFNQIHKLTSVCRELYLPSPWHPISPPPHPHRPSPSLRPTKSFYPLSSM